MPTGFLSPGASAQKAVPGQIPRGSQGRPNRTETCPASHLPALDALYRKSWVVYCKPPFGSPEQVLAYLARYTHRVAISNQRLVRLEDEGVVFTWKDYAAGSRSREMTLSGEEFLRRFLLHVLPDRFVRIRYFGLFANRHREQSLALCREVLPGRPVPPKLDEVRLAVPAPEPYWRRPFEMRGLRTKGPTPGRGTGTGSGPEGSAAMTSSFMARFQYLSAQPWSREVVYLVGSLRYNHRHEIAVAEPRHAADPFAGRSSESHTAALGACVEAGRVSREAPARD